MVHQQTALVILHVMNDRMHVPSSYGVSVGYAGNSSCNDQSQHAYQPCMNRQWIALVILCVMP